MSSFKSCLKEVEKVGIKGDFAEKICKLSIAKTCALFKADPTKNPETGRAIKEDGPMYTYLTGLCKNVKVKEKASNAKAKKPTKATRANLRTVKTPVDDDTFYDADDGNDDVPVYKSPVKKAQQQQQQEPHQNMTNHDLITLRDQIILNIRDEVIIKLANSVKGQVVAEVINNVQDDVKKSIMREVTKSVDVLAQKSVGTAIDHHQDKINALNEKINTMMAKTQNTINTVTSNAIDNITAATNKSTASINTTTSKSTEQIKQELTKSLESIKDSVTNHVKGELLIDLKELWDKTISVQMTDTLTTHANTYIRRMLDEVMQRLAPIERDIAALVTDRVPENLLDMEVAIAPDGINNPVEIARIKEAIIEQEGKVIDHTIKRRVNILVVRDKTEKPKSCKDITYDVIMNYADFKQVFAQALPECLIDPAAGSNAKVAGRNFAFQQDYKNSIIERFIKKCFGKIVGTSNPYIDVLIVDPLNPIIAAADNATRIVLTGDEFKSVYMYKCLTNDILNSKAVSFAPGFIDKIGLSEHLNTCDIHLLKLDKFPETKREFIIYDHREDNNGVEAAKNNLVRALVRKGASLLSSEDFMNTYIAMNQKTYNLAVSKLPDNDLNNNTISFVLGYNDTHGIGAYLKTRGVNVLGLNAEHWISRDFIICDHTKDDVLKKTKALSDVIQYTSGTKKATVITDKEFVNTYIRKHAKHYNTRYSDNINTVFVGGRKTKEPKSKSVKSVKKCK